VRTIPRPFAVDDLHRCLHVVGESVADERHSANIAREQDHVRFDAIGKGGDGIDDLVGVVPPAVLRSRLVPLLRPPTGRDLADLIVVAFHLTLDLWGAPPDAVQIGTGSVCQNDDVRRVGLAPRDDRQQVRQGPPSHLVGRQRRGSVLDMHDTGRRRDRRECFTTFVRIRDQWIDLGEDLVGRSKRSGLRPQRSPSTVGALRRVLDAWLGRKEHRQERARRIEHML